MSVNPLNAGAAAWAALHSPDTRTEGPVSTCLAPQAPPLPAADSGGSWFNRSLPARMLETALRLLQVSEGTRSDLRQHRQASTAAHEHTQQLVHELGRLLVRQGPVSHHDAANANPANLPKLPQQPVLGGNDEWAALPAINAEAESLPCESLAPSLEVYLLSPFRVFANDRAVDDWPNGKGKAIFKYLVTHRGQPVPREVLMEVFWPESDQDAARNNLNVAIYGLRKALARADADYAFVLFRQGCYSFNPELRLWVDAEAFVDCVHRAQVAAQHADPEAAMATYRVAQAIYHSPLLVDDRYEDWLIPHRQSLQDEYLKVLKHLAHQHFSDDDFEACAAMANKMLGVDPCDEEAHRLLMRCYGRMGQTHLALRQYHFCVDALSRELHLIPSPQTVALFQQIRRRQSP